MDNKPVYLWDYDIDEKQFRTILAGKVSYGRLNQEWAIVRPLEYAPYREVIRILGFPGIIQWWPSVRHRIRSESRRRGFDFLAEWLPTKHPELLND